MFAAIYGEESTTAIRIIVNEHNRASDFIPFLARAAAWKIDHFHLIFPGDSTESGMIPLEDEAALTVAVKSIQSKKDKGVKQMIPATKPNPTVEFKFPNQFGSDFEFTAEIMEKPNTFYAQRILNNTFMLRIIAVEGSKLQSPILIEPSNASIVDLKIGSTQTLRGYEQLQQMGQPRLRGKHPPKMDLHYRNEIVILKQPKKSDQP